MRISKMFLLSALLTVLFLALPGYSSALSLNIDEYIYQHYEGGNLVNTSVLSGTANATYSGGVLNITLTNTSSATTGYNGATNLLTGIGFNLPSGVYITGGTVSMTGSTAINFTAPAGGNVSGEWGYDNSPNSGPFNEFVSATTNTNVSAMASGAKDANFSSLSIAPPHNTLNGPEMGLLSGLVSASTAGGLYAIQNSVLISMNLSGSYSGDLLSYINDRNVVLSFGSPDALVPEPSSLSLVLLGSAMMTAAILRRRSRSRA